jgi:hypothetical protein
MQASGSHAGGRNPARVLLVSIGLNCLLGATAFCLWKSSTPPPAISSAITNPVLITVRTQQTVGSNGPPTTLYVTNRFHWRQVESTHYDEYAANLRAIGCPEKTVRDILLADVEKYYEERQLVESRQQPFWSAGRQRQLADREREASFVAMNQERKELIQRLLGIEWSGDAAGPFQRGDLEEQALARFIFGPLPEESFQRAVATINDYEAQERQLRDRSQGILIDEDETGLKNLGRALKSKLSEVLTPDQLDELSARGSALDYFDRDLFAEAMGLTPAEARQIALAKSRTRDAEKFFDMGISDADTDSATRETQFTNTVANLLGAKRFEDFQRAQDRQFKSLFELGQANGLPKETAIAVYDILRLTAEEVERVRLDDTLDEPARQQRFAEMQAAIQQQVSGALGGKAYADYLRHDGAWITNVTKL